jgi:predicted Zn-dependent protease
MLPITVRRRSSAALLAAAALLLRALGPSLAWAQESGDSSGISRVRDAEIESYIREWTTPVFRVAGLDPKAVNIVLINDSQINSFVAGGLNIFIYTGLLTKTQNANQVVGVEAHETGHIAGGHLARMSDEIQTAEIIEIISMIAGMGAAVGAGAGAGNAGPAVIGAGEGLAERNFFRFSRTQEASADQAGATFLEESHQSARGLLDFMKMLQGEEFRAAYRQDPYLRTHPLTQDRVTFFENIVAHSKYSDAPDPSEYAEQHARMIGKLIGFLSPVPEVFRRYKLSDKSIEARYARGAAYHRDGREEEAMREIGSLLAERPDDPFFNELKGQFLFESGKVKESVAPYVKANQLFPRNSLIETEMAQSMVESNDPSYVPAAQAALDDAVTREQDDPDSWRLLAIIYGRQGDVGHTALALAEEAYADGRFQDAKGQAKRAVGILPAGSPGAVRAQDIEDQASRKIKDKD